MSHYRRRDVTSDRADFDTRGRACTDDTDRRLRIDHGEHPAIADAVVEVDGSGNSDDDDDAEVRVAAGQTELAHLTSAAEQ